KGELIDCRNGTWRNTKKNVIAIAIMMIMNGEAARITNVSMASKPPTMINTIETRAVEDPQMAEISRRGSSIPWEDSVPSTIAPVSAPVMKKIATSKMPTIPLNMNQGYASSMEK